MSTVDLGRVMRRVTVLARYWEGILDAELRDAGVTSKQLQLLGVIERDFSAPDDTHAVPAPPAVSEVAEAMVTSHQNVMQTARALERRGFLQIERDPADRRIRRLVLTEEHRRFWRERDPEDQRGLEHLFSVLLPAELACLDGALDRLVPFTERLYRQRGGDST